jgi:NADPH-dependent 2,4-dienoyl-CoA reductase/sulfur reductase-like enzyme
MPSYDTHNYDVLVIGAGGAGLRAAIEASAAENIAQLPLDPLKGTLAAEYVFILNFFRDIKCNSSWRQK